jgi:hypothetical protein
MPKARLDEKRRAENTKHPRKVAKRKTKIQYSSPAKLKVNDLGNGMGAVVFSVGDEINKSFDNHLSDRPEYDTRSNKSDLAGMPFDNYDFGFFILCLRKSAVIEGLRLTGILKDLNGEIQFYWYTSACSWDYAQKHYWNSLQYNFEYIAFSTPEQVMFLAERK